MKREVALAQERFDFKVKEYSEDTFKRLRPFVNLLCDHYGHGSEKLDLKCPEYLKAFHSSVQAYSLKRSDENFARISTALKRIKDENRVDALKDLWESRTGPLTLGIFFLAPLPPTTFIYQKQITILRLNPDRLMVYLGMLRQPSVHRCYMNIEKWLKTYDQPDFANKFGNVLGYEKEMKFSDRIRKMIPEIKLKKYSGSFEDSMQLDGPEVTLMKLAQNQVGLTEDTEAIVKRLPVDTIKKLSSANTVLLKLKPKSAKYFSQISETLTVDSATFYLKVMIVQRNDSEALLIFDSTHQMWTLFAEDKYILSMPRDMARKYFTLTGSHLIYTKQI